MDSLNESFIIEFISANDIPLFDSKSRSSPYITAYISSSIVRINSLKESNDNIQGIKLPNIGVVVGVNRTSVSSSHSLPSSSSSSPSRQIGQIGCLIQTPKRIDCTTAVWNCYRDFHIQPPLDSLLTVELHHYQHQFRSSTTLDTQTSKGSDTNSNILGLL